MLYSIKHQISPGEFGVTHDSAFLFSYFFPEVCLLFRTVGPRLSSGETFQDPQWMLETTVVPNLLYSVSSLRMHTYDTG